VTPTSQDRPPRHGDPYTIARDDLRTPSRLPAAIEQKLDAARSPEAIEAIIRKNERRIARHCRGDDVLICDDAAELMSSALRRLGIAHEVMVDTVSGQAHSYVRVGKSRYDPTSQGVGFAASEEVQAAFDASGAQVAAPAAQLSGADIEEYVSRNATWGPHSANPYAPMRLGVKYRGTVYASGTNCNDTSLPDLTRQIIAAERLDGSLRSQLKNHDRPMSPVRLAAASSTTTSPRVRV